MIHELRQAIYFNTPHGEGIALLVIDYGPQINTIWVVANCQDGRVRHYDSNDITLTQNKTLDINHENN
jgi:hypothetical protein